MKKNIIELEKRLRSKGLVHEADACLRIFTAMESNTRANPYGNISNPMSQVSWADEECTHEFNADQCPVCGKMMDNE